MLIRRRNSAAQASAMTQRSAMRISPASAGESKASSAMAAWSRSVWASGVLVSGSGRPRERLRTMARQTTLGRGLVWSGGVRADGGWSGNAGMEVGEGFGVVGVGEVGRWLVWECWHGDGGFLTVRMND